MAVGASVGCGRRRPPLRIAIDQRLKPELMEWMPLAPAL